MLSFFGMGTSPENDIYSACDKPTGFYISTNKTSHSSGLSRIDDDNFVLQFAIVFLWKTASRCQMKTT
jgi:hypothetical protein